MDKHIAANPLEPNSTSIHIGVAFVTSQEGSDLIPIVFLALSLSLFLGSGNQSMQMKSFAFLTVKLKSISWEIKVSCFVFFTWL